MSDGKVAALFGGPTGERVPDLELAEWLEAYAEMARSGEICGASVVLRYHDGLSGYASQGRVGGYGMVGACTCLLGELTDTARGLMGDD